MKVISLVLVGAMVASMVAMTGCGASGGAAPAADGSAPAEAAPAAGGAGTSEDPNTLTVMAWDPAFNIPALKAAEAAYQEINPDFHLEIIEQSGSGDVETLFTNVGSDTSGKSLSQLPDITLFQDHGIEQYYNNYPDLWVPVDDAGINWDDFSPAKVGITTLDGKHYGVPVDAGTCVAAYHKGYIEAAGHSVDELTGCTWEEFMAIGKDVKAATDKYLLCMDGSGNDLIYIMGQAEGVSQWKDGQPVVAEDPTIIEIVDLICQMQQEGILYLANSWGDYTDQAIQGDMVAGVINGNWILPTIEKVESNAGEWVVTTLPTINGGEGYAANGGSSLYITANCEKQELAKDFLAQTFGGGEAAAATYEGAMADGGVIATWIPAAELDAYQGEFDFFGGQAVYKDIAVMTAEVGAVEESIYHYTLRTNMGVAIQEVTGNGTDLMEALQTAQDTMINQMQ